MTMSISRETSRRITSLRFLLICFVVFYHCNQILPQEATWVSWIKTFLSNGLFLCHVPLFLFFSAYLLATQQVQYRIMMKKKFWTIILPYFLWISLYFSLWFLLKNIPLTSNYADSWYHPVEWNIKALIQIYLGYTYTFNLVALCGQFWFLRDLIFLTIFSPVLIYLFQFKKKFFIAPILMGITTVLFLFQKGYVYVPFPVINLYPIFFFCLGIFCGVNKVNFFALVDKLQYWYLLVILFSLVYLTKIDNLKYVYALPVSQIISCIIWLKFSNTLYQKEKIFTVCKQLSPFAFFIFAAHEPLAIIFVRKILKIIPFSGGWVLIHYILLSSLVILCTLGVAIIMKKLTPKVYSLMCGGRGSE